MTKFWSISLLFLLIFGLASCSSSSKKSKRSTGKKYSQRVKPSESMQAGIAKETTNYVFKNSDSSDEDYEDVVEQNSKNYKGYFKIGNPYQVFGVSYFPQNYEDYEEIGVASWYGDDFHGKPTANGETYDMQAMTAAHPTLPLPSLVRVTNLRNNKSVIVRVNDRGPFAKSRVIDVSERAADLLEFKGQGTTKVKIQLLRDETDALLEKLKIKN